MNSDNDPRAVDWPEKQVARLDGEIERVTENFTVRLDAHDRRLTSVEEEAVTNDRIFNSHNNRIGALETQVSELRTALAAYGVPIAGVRRSYLIDPDFSPPIGGRIVEDGEDPFGFHRRRGDTEDLSSKRVQDVPPGVPLGTRGVVRSEQEAYSRGYSTGFDEGQQTQVSEAQDRVAAILDSLDLGTNIRENILKAVAGQVVVPKNSDPE